MLQGSGVNDDAAILLAALAMAVGLVGTVVPVLPGLGLVWLGALAYGLLAGFGAVGWLVMVVLTVLAVLGTVAGVAVPKRRAGAAGAARSSLWLGALAAVVGFFVVPVVGLPLGGALGIFVGERVRTGDGRAARRATWATLVGFGLAAVIQLAVGVAMVGAWLVWVLAG
jgi:uncharacterized protein YqgC (DUF456 family)